MNSPRRPFEIRILQDGIVQNGTEDETRDFTRMLPATTRTEHDDIITPSLADITFLEKELLVKSLDKIVPLLWLCGRSMPPRTLHHQALLRRDIVVTEDMKLHLVWHKTRIFIKPIPAYLLDPDFWLTQVLPQDGEDDPKKKRRSNVEECARGFLFTYTALIAYPSDFRIAKSKGLLPEEVTWANWQLLTAQLLKHHHYADVNPRYWYGELRLSRLNKIYRFRMVSPLRGYSLVSGHMSIGELVGENFALLGSLLAYVAIVLTAMQVGLETPQLQFNHAFQNASYGFTVFSIIAPLIGAVIILMGVVVLMSSNMVATKKYEWKRLESMGVKPMMRRIRTGKAEKMV